MPDLLTVLEADLKFWFWKTYISYWIKKDKETEASEKQSQRSTANGASYIYVGVSHLSP
ncbi:hypothetical protein HispidOSU_010240 [Sigmodon hispidus]